MSEIKKAAIIGAGIMGNGIAQVLAQAGFDVAMTDIEDKFIQRGIASIKKSLGRMKKRGKIAEDEVDNVLGRIKGTLDLKEAVSDADLVIEAIPEDLNLKQQAFKQLDELCPAHTVLATNTSTISITAIASVTQRQDKVIGMHFANPVPLMKGVEIIKGLDRSRPVTFASNKAERDTCLDLVDIVSWNRYVGWYHDEPGDAPDDLKRLLKWLHSSASGAKGKPVILSEFGAGAIPGYRHPSHVKWTEEYQAECLDAQLAAYLDHPDVTGCAIWQFCDIRNTTEDNRFNSRPRTMNNKGTVDELRRPKLAYGVVKRRMHEARKNRDQP